MPTPTLETPRLILRPLELADADQAQPLFAQWEIVKQLNEVIVAAMQTQEFRDHLATLGAEPKPQTPQQFARYINADVAKWSKLVKDNDVQLPGGN